jgi:MOSC domain-containing protein YiiM
MPTLLAACVVHALRNDPGSVGTTGIDKRPVSGPVKVGRFGLRADVQADRKFHGGETKAVYAYSQEDADFWQSQLGRPLDPGWFGENLRTAGIDLTAVRSGERWRIGDTLEIEATTPRFPCATFARWVGGANAKGWVKRFADEGRVGAYFKVNRNGRIEAGDTIEVLSVPESAPTILELFRA